MKSRIKIPLHQLTTRDDAEAAMNDLALIVNNQRRTIAKRDAEVLLINHKYEGNLAAYDQALKEKTELLRAWAETNPDQFPRGRKSLELTSGTLGFRTGTPKLSPLSRAWTWDKILKAILTGGLSALYIRTAESVDKERILADHSATPDKSNFDANLRQIGLRVIQDETFFIEPQLTTIDLRQTTTV